MAQVILGTKRTADGGAKWLSVSNSANSVRALRLVVPSEPLWLTRLGVYARRADKNNATVRIAVWEANPFDWPKPAELLAYTGPITVGKAAAAREGPLVWSKRGVAMGIAGAAQPLAPGRGYWIGVVVDKATAEISQRTNAPGTITYQRNGSGAPPNPFGVGATANQTEADLWAVCATNTAPGVSLTGPATEISAATPVFTGAFSDADDVVGVYDRMSGYRIELREADDEALLWEVDAAASAAERAAHAFSRPYAGPALSEASYLWRALVIDDAGAPSDMSDWRVLTLANFGNVDSTNSTPTGKIEYGVVTGSWTGRWSHPLSRSANAAKVRILSGDVILREGPLTTGLSVANNAFISLTNTQAGVALAANPLPPGAYTWQMQARDSSGDLSPWSEPVLLAVNAPPDQPAGLRPPSGVTVSERPTLEWMLTDPDLDDVLGAGVSSIVEVTRPDLSLSTTETTDVDPGTGRGYLLVTGTIAPGNGDYQWRVRGRDLSAAGTPAEYGPWSAPSRFILTTAPIVAITSPVENGVIGTSTPQIAWSVTDGLMAQFRVQLYRSGQSAPFYSSGQLTVTPSSLGVFNVPAGWVRNGLAYEADVTIWTGGGISSTSPRRAFRVSYADANLVGNVTAGTTLERRDSEPTSVVISWETTSYPQSQFAGYVIWRRPTGAAPDQSVPIALLRQPGQTQYVDHHAPPNTPLVYAVSQMRRAGADVQVSEPVEVDAELELHTPVLASLLSGGTLRGAIKWLFTGIGGGFARADGLADTWGSKGRKVWVRTPPGHGARSFSLKYTIRDDDEGTLKEHWDDVTEMVESNHPFSFRDERETTYVRIVPGNRYWQRGATVGTVDITLELEEIAWDERVKLPS